MINFIIGFIVGIMAGVFSICLVSVSRDDRTELTETERGDGGFGSTGR